MSKKENESLRYSDEELKEFKKLIDNKLADARKDYSELKSVLSMDKENGTNDTASGYKAFEDAAELLSKEEAALLAERQRNYITNLENALMRIENKTYGICRVTGKLIAKERLRSVPHTTMSIDAKLSNRAPL